MGVDADKVRTGLGGARSKPPPIPPRPLHLVPAKTMAKYSSMPDVLNGWRRDPNPDLLKLDFDGLGGAKNGAAVSAKISALDVATPRNGYRQNGVASAQQLYDARIASANGRCQLAGADGRKMSPKKLGCMPSRNHSKKKSKTDYCAGDSVPTAGAVSDCDRGSCAPSVGAKNRPEISQTSWYVDDAVGNSRVQLSKCEINVNGCATDNGSSDCRYIATINRSKSSSTSPSSTLTSTASPNCAEAPSRSKFSFFRKFRPGSSANAKAGGVDHPKKAATCAPCISGPLPSAPFFASLNGPPPISSSAYAGPSPLATFSTTLTGPSPGASSSVTRLPPIPNSSPALARLPPLPKCFTEASPLWDPPENKKVSSHSVNLSPSSSCASSSSRSTSRSTSSGGYPKVPLQSSSSSRSGSVGFDGATSSKSTAAAATGDAAQRSDRRPMPPPPPPPPRKPTSLDIKLATLRKEMQDLRQMDLTLLSQLWSLNEAITEFRHMQVCLSPDCPSVHSSDDEEEEDSGCYYSNLSSQGIVTNNQQSNTLGSTSSRSSASTNRSRETTKPR